MSHPPHLFFPAGYSDENHQIHCYHLLSFVRWCDDSWADLFSSYASDHGRHHPNHAVAVFVVGPLCFLANVAVLSSQDGADFYHYFGWYYYCCAMTMTNISSFEVCYAHEFVDGYHYYNLYFHFHSKIDHHHDVEDGEVLYLFFWVGAMVARLTMRMTMCTMMMIDYYYL